MEPRLAVTAVSEASLAGDACIAEQRGAWAVEFSGLSASFEAVTTASAKFDLSLRLAERTVEALVQRLGDAQAARSALRALARPAEIPLPYAGSSCSRRAPDGVAFLHRAPTAVDQARVGGPRAGRSFRPSGALAGRAAPQPTGQPEFLVRRLRHARASRRRDVSALPRSSGIVPSCSTRS